MLSEHLVRMYLYWFEKVEKTRQMTCSFSAAGEESHMHPCCLVYILSSGNESGCSAFELALLYWLWLGES